MRRLLASAAAALLALAAASPQAAPTRYEQMVWSALSFNGHDYSSTIAPASADTIYLLAGQDCFLSPRATLVYWWPLENMWKADIQTLFDQQPGTLELIDSRGRVSSIAAKRYIYFNARGEYELNWKVLTGEAALSELKRYALLNMAYYQATEAYKKANAAYEREIERLTAEIGRLKAEGRDSSLPNSRILSMRRPEEPTPPADYAVPPSNPQEGFVLNLPRGEYSIRLKYPDGRTLEGSDKRLVVHERRRSGRVGYEIIPGDKWTRPEQSMTPFSTIYADGSADLFLRPFFEDEFNDLAYEKTLEPQARGNPNVWKWVRIQQVPKGRIEATKSGGRPALLGEEPYAVEQIKGTSLGYTIVPLKEAKPGSKPDIIAMRVETSKGMGPTRLRAFDAQGAPLPGSERLVRVVGPYRSSGLLVLMALLPLLAMAIILVLRSRSYSKN